MSEADQEPLREGEDYYMDGAYLVFTAAYHRKRGYCCGSRCRHCPYGGQIDPLPPSPAPSERT